MVRARALSADWPLGAARGLAGDSRVRGLGERWRRGHGLSVAGAGVARRGVSGAVVGRGPRAGSVSFPSCRGLGLSQLCCVARRPGAATALVSPCDSGPRFSRL